MNAFVYHHTVGSVVALSTISQFVQHFALLLLLLHKYCHNLLNVLFDITHALVAMVSSNSEGNMPILHEILSKAIIHSRYCFFEKDFG